MWFRSTLKVKMASDFLNGSFTFSVSFTGCWKLCCLLFPGFTYELQVVFLCVCVCGGGVLALQGIFKVLLELFFPLISLWFLEHLSHACARARVETWTLCWQQVGQQLKCCIQLNWQVTHSLHPPISLWITGNYMNVTLILIKSGAW